MMMLKYLICNHKNKLTYNEVKQYISNLNKIDISKVNFVICPSLPYIYNFIDYQLGAQDISYSNETMTGEITGKQLKDLLIKYVIIGHPERKKYLNENSEILIQKIKNANDNNIRVIYCLSENELDLDRAKRVLKDEFESVKKYLKKDAIIAYEPEWAIGNRLDLDYQYIFEIIDYLKTLTDNDVIYGGSVNEQNVETILKNDNISGFLISNSALDVSKLQNIIKKMT
jgi:triosephosphate isomerase